MGFLAPALLLMGAAVVVPLVLHLFQRHQGPKVVFPALRYLRRAETEHARRIRLRQWLLMLLRIGVLAVLAAAAARPFLRAAGAGHEPTAVAIVLDNSMSSGLVVGDRRTLDHLKDRAIETLQRAGPEDRFWLIRAGQAWEPAFPGDAEATAARVRETEPTAAAADLEEALAHARAVLESGAGARAKEIHLLSDLQASNLPTQVVDAGPAAPPIVVWSPTFDLPPNSAVTGVDVGGGVPPTEGQRSTVTARVEGSAGADSVSVRLTIDDRLVAVSVARAGDAVLLPFPARSRGIAMGWVTTDPDALRADDRRAFAFDVRPAPRVASTGPQPLVDQALAVLENAGRIRRTPVSEADVLILPAGVGLEGVRPDVAVILPAPDSVLDLPAVNRRLDAAGIAWRVEPSAQVGEARFAVGSSTDPLLRTLGGVRVTRAFALIRPERSADSVLLRLTDGSPWAVRGERAGGGTWVLLASSLAESATTLPASAAMIPLMDRLTTAWAGPAGAAAALRPGQEIPVPPAVDAVRRPDGIVEPVSPGGSYRLGHEAGLYLLTRGDSIVTALAVNPPAAESDLTRVGLRALGPRLPGWPLHTVARAGDWPDRIYRGRVGREVWRPALFAAIVFLLLEAAVAATGTARPRLGTARNRPTDASADASADASPVRAG